jgi:hypothetical protein
MRRGLISLLFLYRQAGSQQITIRDAIVVGRVCVEAYRTKGRSLSSPNLLNRQACDLQITIRNAVVARLSSFLGYNQCNY